MFQLLIPFDPHLMDHLPLLATYESYLILGYLFLILVVAGLI